MVLDLVNWQIHLSRVKVVSGEYEVGVHIADVTYFLNAGTCLDAVAGSRATSVYLVQKVGSTQCLSTFQQDYC